MAGETEDMEIAPFTWMLYAALPTDTQNTLTPGHNETTLRSQNDWVCVPHQTGGIMTSSRLLRTVFNMSVTVLVIVKN